MPESISQNIFNLSASHEHYVNRLGVSMAREANQTLNGSYSDARAELVNAIERLRESYDSDTTRTKSRFRSDLQEVVDAIAAIRGPLYVELQNRLEEQLREFSEYEAEFQQERIFERAAELALEDLPIVIPFAAAAASSIYSAAMLTRLSLGQRLQGTIQQLMTGISRSESRRIFDAVVFGFDRRNSNQQIIRSVFNSQSGSAETSKSAQSIRGLTTAAVNSIQTQAHRLTAEANEDLIRGWQNVGVTDSRQSRICRSIALELGNRVFPNYTDIPPTPRHLNCRSQVVAVLQSWQNAFRTNRLSVVVDGRIRRVNVPQNASSSRIERELRDVGLTNQQIINLKRAMSGRPSENTLSSVLQAARRRGDNDFLVDFFESRERAQLYVDGRFTAEQLYDLENRKPVSIEQLRAMS